MQKFRAHSARSNSELSQAIIGRGRGRGGQRVPYLLNGTAYDYVTPYFDSPDSGYSVDQLLGCEMGVSGL